MTNLAQRRLSVARGIIKSHLRSQGMKLSHFNSVDIIKAAKQVIAADPVGIDAEVARGMGQLWSPNEVS